MCNLLRGLGIPAALLLPLVLAVPATAQVGSTKVQPKFFNPFSFDQLSRFGVGALGTPNVSAFTSGSSDASLEESEASAPVSSGSVEVSVSSSSSGRPSYAPQSRSPFRPPPRPPF